MRVFSISRAALLLICVVPGYVPMGDVAAMGAKTTAVTLCDVADHPTDYRGSALNLRARYSSDKGTFEYLELPSCPRGARLIDIGKHGHSVSVAKFYAEIEKICKARRSHFVCNTSADVEVVGTVREWPSDPGHFVFDLEEIEQFKFDSEK
jgi:hypothetical protein